MNKEWFDENGEYAGGWNDEWQSKDWLGNTVPLPPSGIDKEGNPVFAETKDEKQKKAPTPKGWLRRNDVYGGRGSIDDRDGEYAPKKPYLDPQGNLWYSDVNDEVNARRMAGYEMDPNLWNAYLRAMVKQNPNSLTSLAAAMGISVASLLKLTRGY